MSTVIQSSMSLEHTHLLTSAAKFTALISNFVARAAAANRSLDRTDVQTGGLERGPLNRFAFDHGLAGRDFVARRLLGADQPLDGVRGRADSVDLVDIALARKAGTEGQPSVAGRRQTLTHRGQGSREALCGLMLAGSLERLDAVEGPL